MYLSLLYVCSGIIKKVEDLYASGGTALGPALAVCVGLTAKIPYSEIILCTDGEPNEGVGTLVNGVKQAEKFYTKVSIDPLNLIESLLRCHLEL